MRGVPRADPAALGRLACDLASFSIPVAVYIASASHEPGSWDTAELQGVPYILGITHPTGFPLYVLLGYAWSHLLPLGSIAFRMNAMSAVAMAAAGSTAYAVSLELGAWRPIALLATLWYAFAQDVWSHANRAEAQDLAVMCEALAIYAFLRWMKEADGRWLVAAGALVGLGLASHPNAIWLVPAFVAGILVARRRPCARRVAVCAAIAIGGLLLYAYLPIRSAYVVAHGLDPTAVLPGTDGGIFWNYNDPSTPSGLLRALSGSESQAPQLLPRIVKSAARATGLLGVRRGNRRTVRGFCARAGGDRIERRVETRLANDPRSLSRLYHGAIVLGDLFQRSGRRALPHHGAMADGTAVWSGVAGSAGEAASPRITPDSLHLHRGRSRRVALRSTRIFRTYGRRGRTLGDRRS